MNKIIRHQHSTHKPRGKFKNYKKKDDGNTFDKQAIRQITAIINLFRSKYYQSIANIKLHPKIRKEKRWYNTFDKLEIHKIATIVSLFRSKHYQSIANTNSRTFQKTG